MEVNLYMSVAMLAYILIGIAYAFKERETIVEIEDKSRTSMSENEELIKSYSNVIQEYKILQMEHKRTDLFEAEKIVDKINALQEEIKEIEERNSVQDFSTIKKFFDDDTILKIVFGFRVAFWLPIMCWNGLAMIVILLLRTKLIYSKIKYHYFKKRRDRLKEDNDRLHNEI
jgi:ABC-type siderophore export system fused ATPase/permease subunit